MSSGARTRPAAPAPPSSQNVEAVARRVVELLQEEGLLVAARSAVVGGLVDAAAVARDLGVSRDFVYAHKAELGGVPLGEGPRPRWGFDLAEVRGRLAARCVSERSPVADSPAAVGRLPHRRRGRSGDGVDLLPLRGDRRAA